MLLAIALVFAVVGAVKLLVAAVALSLMIAFAVLALISYMLGTFVRHPSR
jgi:hypothetical protein